MWFQLIELSISKTFATSLFGSVLLVVLLATDQTPAHHATAIPTATQESLVSLLATSTNASFRTLLQPMATLKYTMVLATQSTFHSTTLAAMWFGAVS